MSDTRAEVVMPDEALVEPTMPRGVGGPPHLFTNRPFFWLVLGSGGDCCKPGGGANLSIGTFYEGCIVTGYPADATEDAVQANIVAAGYGK